MKKLLLTLPLLTLVACKSLNSEVIEAMEAAAPGTTKNVKIIEAVEEKKDGNRTVCVVLQDGEKKPEVIILTQGQNNKALEVSLMGTMAVRLAGSKSCK